MSSNPIESILKPVNKLLGVDTKPASIPKAPTNDNAAAQQAVNQAERDERKRAAAGGRSQTIVAGGVINPSEKDIIKKKVLGG